MGNRPYVCPARPSSSPIGTSLVLKGCFRWCDPTRLPIPRQVVEAEIPTDPIVERLNLVEEENNYLMEKIKRIEEEKMLLELHVSDVVNDKKIKMDAMSLKIRKIRKYAIDTEAWYHYVVGSIVTFVAIMIAFVVALKCFT